jgi:hypothetical protein
MSALDAYRDAAGPRDCSVEHMTATGAVAHRYAMTNAFRHYFRLGA